MLVFQKNQWFDLNKIALVLGVLIAIVIFFLPIKWYVILFLELVISSNLFYLYRQVNNYRAMKIMVNDDSQWYLELDDSRYAVEIKDYWLLTGCILVWLKGSNKSVSFKLSRSIIGAQNFSLLRTKIL